MQTLDFLKNIYRGSPNPVIIFNDKKIILFSNHSFDSLFEEQKRTNQSFDFLYSKTEEGHIPVNKLKTETLTSDTQIFSFFKRNLQEDFFWLTTFYVGVLNNEKIYYSVAKKITDIEERLIENAINALVTASQLKDKDTGNHIKRVNAYSYIFSKYLYETKKNIYSEIDNEFIEKISKVASMHDVGKIGTPDYILTKPGKLTEEEFIIMQEHTINGAFILSKMAGQMARDIALSHHEKWNGSGYPYSLKGEQIPLCARIVTIADVYDALRMKRHYKPPFSHEETTKIILEKKGTDFEPELVESYMEINIKFKEIFDKIRDESDEMDFNISD